jgi:hypothetical protein
MKRIVVCIKIVVFFFVLSCPATAVAWFDETHLAISKVAGYHKWYLSAGADMVKEKLGDRELHNHYVNNPRSTEITPEMVLDQVNSYDQIDPQGHLYGAIIASLRNYIEITKKGKYGEYQLGFCAHYVGDLSQPLHHTLYNPYNQKYHLKTDGIVNDGVLDNLKKIKLYEISIDSEQDLAEEIARISNLSLRLGYRIEDENRIMTEEEAYQQLSHSASLFKAILDYAKSQIED